MARYDGLIIPRSYSEYINKTDAATLQQALQQSGVLSETVAADDNKAVRSSAVANELNNFSKIIGEFGHGSNNNSYVYKISGFSNIGSTNGVGFAKINVQTSYTTVLSLFVMANPTLAGNAVKARYENIDFRSASTNFTVKYNLSDNLFEIFVKLNKTLTYAHRELFVSDMVNSGAKTIKVEQDTEENYQNAQYTVNIPAPMIVE